MTSIEHLAFACTSRAACASLQTSTRAGTSSAHGPLFGLHLYSHSALAGADRAAQTKVTKTQALEDNLFLRRPLSCIPAGLLIVLVVGTGQRTAEDKGEAEQAPRQEGGGGGGGVLDSRRDMDPLKTSRRDSVQPSSVLCRGSHGNSVRRITDRETSLVLVEVRSVPGELFPSC
jgi:hypothetical protein